MNASQSMLRALRGLGYAALLLTIFEACSGDDASAPLPPGGPASIEITGIALGQGFVGDGVTSAVLGCDYTIGVNVQTDFWTLYPPGRCGGALQCGQLRVSLLDGLDGAEILTVVAAGNGVALDVGSLRAATPPLTPTVYAIKAELVDDLGKVYIPLDGGNGSAQREFVMALPLADDCVPDPDAGTGTGGAGTGTGGAGTGTGSAGAGGDSAGPDAGGAAGTAGAAGAAGA